jgi:hypothetical protein
MSRFSSLIDHAVMIIMHDKHDPGRRPGPAGPAAPAQLHRIRLSQCIMPVPEPVIQVCRNRAVTSDSGVGPATRATEARARARAARRRGRRDPGLGFSEVGPRAGTGNLKTGPWALTSLSTEAAHRHCIRVSSSHRHYDGHRHAGPSVTVTVTVVDSGGQVCLPVLTSWQNASQSSLLKIYKCFRAIATQRIALLIRVALGWANQGSRRWQGRGSGALNSALCRPAP